MMREAGIVGACLLVVAGAALIFLPAAFIVAGVLLGALMFWSTP